MQELKLLLKNRNGMKQQHDNMDIEKYIGINRTEYHCVKKKKLHCYLCFSFSFLFLRVILKKNWYEAFSEYFYESDMSSYQQICI